jgi:hypothetical protein
MFVKLFGHWSRYFTTIWYILWPFGTFLSCKNIFPVLVFCTKKNLATLARRITFITSNFFEEADDFRSGATRSSPEAIWRRFNETVSAVIYGWIFNGAKLNILVCCFLVSSKVSIMSLVIFICNFRITFYLLHREPILRLLNSQLQRQRCSRLERFYIRANNFSIKNAPCYFLRYKFLQRWSCNSRS